ncbi:unnamed protein product [Oikopleura dioica]|uniref:Inward rectifier K(+) channel Kir3.1 n=1 Tax=Oikopleura dioica TaxID=34765 RepID=E4XNB0_OIKDI|nr:unnamed protein product [Oikopleura dioica]
MGLKLFDEPDQYGKTPNAKGMGKKPQVPRFMKKTGECNIRQDSKEKFERFISDFFTTMIDLPFSIFMLSYVSFYVFSWVIFSRYYWLVNDTTYERPVCFENVNSFKTAFLFFVETETTVGYGKRTITANCPEAILLLIIQCLAGTMVDAFMVGCIFIKISKPQNKNDTLIFSDNAVIAIRDGKYNFMFRIGNLRNSLFVKCICKVKFIKSKQTIEGEFLPLDQRDMDVGTATGADKLFLVTPMVIKHEINEKSPFWEMSCTDMMAEQFEIIVILEGVVESTGQSSQARTSYLNNEILWGHRYDNRL